MAQILGLFAIIFCVLSGLHGFTSALTRVDPYEAKLSETFAAELASYGIWGAAPIRSRKGARLNGLPIGLDKPQQDCNFGLFAGVAA